jgi:hypothetical protein
VCGTTDVIELDLPRSLEAPAQARRMIEQHLCREHGRAALAAAQLLATELATCAVLYGDPPITLRLECEVSRLWISVAHAVEGSAPADIPIDEEGDLRSALLSKLSRSWGVDRVEEGRVLWSCLPTGAIPAPAASAMTTRRASVSFLAAPGEEPLPDRVEQGW